MLKQHFKEIAKLNSSEQVWQMPFFAALGVGIVLGLKCIFWKIKLWTHCHDRSFIFFICSKHSFIS